MCFSINKNNLMNKEEIKNKIINIIKDLIIDNVQLNKQEKIQMFAAVVKEASTKMEFNVPQTKENIVKHYTEGAVKAVKAMTLPETEASKARLEVCKGCDKWTGTSCKVCGCYVNLKVKIPEEKCPEGKW